MSSRDQMIADLKSGAAADTGDASNKSVLIRGCDPVMAQRASGFMPALLGNCHLSVCTDDNTFLKFLEESKFDVVGFAPGACRWDRAGKPIPGGNADTQGWSLEKYRDKVRELQGENVKIVGTADEKELVPVFRKALGLK